MPANRIATNQDVLKALGLDSIQNIKHVSIDITPGCLPTAIITVALPKVQKPDWLGIINSGASHSHVLKLIRSIDE